MARNASGRGVMVIRVRCTSVSKAGHSRRNLSGLGHDICNAEATQKRRQLLGFARIGRLARTDTSGRLACQTVVAAPRWTAQTPRAPAPAPLSARRHLAATTSPISAGLGLPGRESLCVDRGSWQKRPAKTAIGTTARSPRNVSGTQNLHSGLLQAPGPSPLHQASMP